MKISIITSCFNREATIAEAIRSVMGQDYGDVEYIVVDGASTDGSLKIIENLKAEIESEDFRKKHQKFTIKVISEQDHGMYEAINKGIKMATGDIIGLVHSDDTLYDCHVLTNIAECFKKTKADFIYGDGIFVDSVNTTKVIRNWIGGEFKRWKVRCGWLPLHPTCYIRRDVMHRAGMYDESYKIAADSDLLVRYLYKANISVVYLKKYIIRMRMGGLSTDKRKRKAMWKEDVRLYKAHGFSPVVTKIMKMMWKVPQFIVWKRQ